MVEEAELDTETTSPEIRKGSEATKGRFDSAGRLDGDAFGRTVARDICNAIDPL